MGLPCRGTRWLVLCALIILGLGLGCRRAKPPIATESYAAATESPVVEPIGGTGVSTTQPTLVNTHVLLPTTATASDAVDTPTGALVQPTDTPLASATKIPAATSVQHVVQHRETLSQLARTYNTTVAAILQLNPTLTDPDLLSPGTVLTIIAGRTSPRSTHRVVAGETVYGIARHYGTTAQAIIDMNALGDPNHLIVEQRLYIP